MLAFLHEKPPDEDSTLFTNVETLIACGAHNPRGRNWHLFHSPSLPRDWVPDDGLTAKVETLVSDLLSEAEGQKRVCIVRTARRRATPGASVDELPSFVWFCDCSSPEVREDTWKDGRVVAEARVPNRHLVFCYTPHQKLLEVGHDHIAADTANRILEAFAQAELGLKGELDELTAGLVNLDRLVERPDFRTLKAHGIKYVSVKKLVLLHGPGTRTHYVRAASKSDAYDVVGASGLPIKSGRILAATLRVEFEKQKGHGPNAISFELGVPNKCTLREQSPRHKLVLETYLRQWGLVTPHAEAEPIIRIGPEPTPLADLLGLPAEQRLKSNVQTISGKSFDFLVKYKALQPRRSDGYICPECNDVHFRDPSVLPGLGYYCPNVLRPTRPVQTVEEYVADPAVLAYWLAHLLPIDVSNCRMIREGALFFLGIGGGDRDWPALFAPALDTAAQVDVCLDAIEPELRKAKGILITPKTLPKRLSVPGKHEVVLLDRLMRWSNGQFELSEETLKAALDRKSIPRRPGRPSLRSEGERIALIRSEFGLCADDRGQEAIAMLGELKRWYPEGDLPSAETIRDKWLKAG